MLPHLSIMIIQSLKDSHEFDENNGMARARHEDVGAL